MSAEDIQNRLAEIEQVRLDSVALGVLSEERRDALRDVIYGLEEDRAMLDGLVDAYAGSDDADVVHLLSFVLAGAANIEVQAGLVAPLVLRAVAELRVSYPWPRVNLCTAVQRIGFLAGLWEGKLVGRPTADDKKAIVRLIEEGLRGPPAVRASAAQLLLSLYLPGDMSRFDPEDEARLRAQLLAFDGAIPEDILTQGEIDTLKELIAQGAVPAR
jgi:hypothetical protein